MADDAFYMKKALEEARRAYDEDEIPVGAVWFAATVFWRVHIT